MSVHSIAQYNMSGKQVMPLSASKRGNLFCSIATLDVEYNVSNWNQRVKCNIDVDQMQVIFKYFNG